MKTSLQLRLSQQLTLTPQLQQAIRLLQLSTVDLNQEIQEALETNPMLEISNTQHDITIAKKSDLSATEKPTVVQDTSFHEHYASAPISKKPMADKIINQEQFHSKTTTLNEHLLWQLTLTPMSDTDYAIAVALIDAINEDGFLTQTSEELQEILSSEHTPIGLDEVEAVRHRLLRFDPVGTAAHSLQESLLVQLEQMEFVTPHTDLTKRIIEQDIQLLGQHNYRQIMRNHKVDETTLQSALDLIQSLHPKPGNLIDSGETQYVIPDVIVEKEDDVWHVRLNGDALPSLGINGQYASLVKRANTTTDNTFLKSNLQEARWFLKSIQSRQDTLLKVASSIVELQHAFLEQGEVAMKPLILNKIAEKLDLHESTISRVTTQKYIHTPRGVYELKYFFSSHVETNSGGECSSTAIRAVLKSIIANENTRKPLSDNQIAHILNEQGINIARRTIAKYRESMGIPPSNERKSLNN
jgi:RNA polymerase sigma-54 factor